MITCINNFVFKIYNDVEYFTKCVNAAIIQFRILSGEYEMQINLYMQYYITIDESVLIDVKQRGMFSTKTLKVLKKYKAVCCLCFINIG